MTPQRIQRKRTKDWKMPVNTVYVGRPGKWGNPWKVDCETTPENAVNSFRDCAEHRHSGPWQTYPPLEEIQAELRGKNLVCWCPLDQPCHADVLLDIANTE